jgi:hypothetical protein
MGRDDDAIGMRTMNESIEATLAAKRDALMEKLSSIRECMDGIRQQEREALAALADCAAAARTFGVALDIALPVKVDGPQVKNFVLERLAAVGAVGIKTPVLRQEFKQLTGREVHEKTMGMTLYRLKTDGAAVRRGRVWFAA